VPIRPDGFWRDFSIRLTQRKEISPRKLNGVIFGRRGGSGPLGANVLLEFDAAEVESAPVHVEVVPPEGPRAQTTFDLDKLR
jgi:hypothetical protein